MPGVTLSNVDLYVNGGQLHDSQIKPLTRSSPDQPISILREKYEREGYVFLKKLLPREDILQCRKRYFELLKPTGVLAPGSKPVEGIFDATQNRLNFPGVGAGPVDESAQYDRALAQNFVDLALQAHHEDFYANELCKHPRLLEFIAKFTGWNDKMLALRRTLLRNSTPGNRAIGVHYDQIFLRHGEPSVITAWVPIGDISLGGGGLIYLEGGDSLGSEIEQDFMDKAQSGGLTSDEARDAFNKNMMSSGFLTDYAAEFSRDYNRCWLVSDYEAGDVVLHKAHMIHASTINRDPDNKIRLATDLRFVDASRSYDTRWSDTFDPHDGL